MRGIHQKSVKYFYIFSIILLLIVIPMISAGFFESLKKTITGKVSSQPTNVSITISGTRSVNISVWNWSLTGAITNPSEENYTTISFNVTVRDDDGASDINDSSIVASFYKSGETMRNISGNNCTINPSETTTYTKNYSCQINMWYWDYYGQWTINVTANDLGNMTYMVNNTRTFQYNQLQSIKISPSLISWSAVTPGGNNLTAAVATTINNTGNYNVSVGSIQINATNLYNGANMLGVANITGDVDSGVASCDGTNLTNGIFMGITVANLTRGNISLGGGVAQELIYYCLTTVPNNLPSGTYDTTTSGAWTIKIV